MGRPVERTFTQSKTILKFFDYKGAACVVPESMGEDVNGYKVVTAGTPFPSNDASCKGYLLHDVDVTNGDAPGTYVFEGSIDNAKLAEAGVEVATAAKTATPRVTFFD